MQACPACQSPWARCACRSSHARRCWRWMRLRTTRCRGLSAAGPAPKPPGRAAGTVSTPVYGLTALSSRNLQSCFSFINHITGCPVTWAGSWLSLAGMCVHCIILIISQERHCGVLSKPPRVPSKLQKYRERCQAVFSSPALLLDGALLTGFTL